MSFLFRFPAVSVSVRSEYHMSIYCCTHQPRSWFSTCKINIDKASPSLTASYSRNKSINISAYPLLSILKSNRTASCNVIPSHPLSTMLSLGIANMFPNTAAKPMNTSGLSSSPATTRNPDIGHFMTTTQPALPQVQFQFHHNPQLYLQSAIFPSPGAFLLNLIISIRNFYHYFVPDIVKNIISFVLLAYFLIFFFTSLLPLMLIGIPILLAVGYVVVKSNKLINRKITSNYIKYLDSSSFTLKPPYTVDLINYDNIVKVSKIRALVLQRIKYATQTNENGINKYLFGNRNRTFGSSSEPYVNLSLSELVSLQAQSLSYIFGNFSSAFSSSPSSKFGVDDDYDYESLITYGFNLREASSTNYKNIAQVNVILGYPKLKQYNLYNDDKSRVSHDEIFEQLFKQQSMDEDLSYQPQKLIVEIIPWNSGIFGTAKRFILNTGLESDQFDRVDHWQNMNGDGDIITIKNHRTKVVD